MSIYKITLLGDAGVGKTSLRKQFMGEGFKQSYAMTIGADFAVYKIDDYILHIWDLAGQIRFGSIIESYYIGTVGSVLVFDITREESLDNLASWIGELMKHNSDKIVPLILVGNKADLRNKVDNPVDIGFATEYAEELSDWSRFTVPYFEASALTGLNVENVFTTLVEEINQSLQF